MNEEIKSFNWNSTWNKYKWHIAPFLIFVITIIVSLNILSNDPNKITLSLTVLGAGFAIFQFWVGELNTANRKKYDIKLTLYKEYSKSIDQFTTLFNFKFNISNLEDAEDKGYLITKAYADLTSILKQCKIIFDISEKDEVFKNLFNSTSTLHSHITKYRENILKLRNDTFNLKKSEMQENITLWKEKSDKIKKELKNMNDGIPFDNNSFFLHKEMWECSDQSTKIKVRFVDIEYNVNAFSIQFECINNALPILKQLNKLDKDFKNELFSRM